MDDLTKTYPQFHREKLSVHVYPTEWVIRTMLGRYPRLALDSTKYRGARILDLGFGDCRNMPLLENCGFEIFGVEIDDDVIALGTETLHRLGIKATLRKGRNAAIPFEDNFFEYLLACYSCYYVDRGTTFADNVNEMARVLKPGGTLIASFTAPGNFILKDARALDAGHVLIAADPFNLRNGYTFRSFESESEICETFGDQFTDIAVSSAIDDYWGLQINTYFMVATKA